MTLRTLLRDSRGASAVEFAFAIPVILTVMIGILQFALVLQASGAIRHAAGEGVRYAKVHPSATETEVLNKVRDSLAGVRDDGIVSLSLQRGTAANGATYSSVAIQYKLAPVIPFASVGPIVLDESMSSYDPT
ncbi:TadE/TadG family type IV pilus assembly protein [Novosphingobium mangrovi (ex Huang et al. 2023)]|uniref:Pilus assembly protein n=1 Tax=Novosphingobium mangrovi (ex Huang et al. 2023) TaxID=2976432 RepID=A0ABT2I0P0_9SPHN|nr:TadE family protein [Novosphingobium mangrovi (ex Huang et al. 2023)]MCT2398233.1 pilus assembly protein [Novosphingobium mangrovi (ex Huang et al. 2023)]